MTLLEKIFLELKFNRFATMKQILFFTLAIILTACSTYSEDDKQNFDSEISEYLEKNNLDCKKSESGIYYQFLEKGDGDKILYDDVVFATYEGKLLDGTVFDEQKEPVELKFSDMIMGWKEVLLQMNVGDKVFVAIPPQHGYGDYDLDDIPKNSSLIFEIEVEEVR